MIASAFTKSYGTKKVLSFPETEFAKGKIYAVIGPNGSAKSTMAKVLVGIEKSDSKNAVLKDCCVGYMPQKSFPFRMSVKNNIFLNGNNKDRADYLIKQLGLDSLSERAAKKLSGGETAKMALARLMMRHYDMLILDEPCASMDMKSTLITEKLLKEYILNENGVIILITHSLQQASRIADEVLFFENGNLIEKGETSIILSNPFDSRTKEFINFQALGVHI